MEPLLTLAIDIGGTGIKAAVLDPDGVIVRPRIRQETPHPATPDAVLAVIEALAAPLAPYHRASAGFPGVVVDGRTLGAANLGPTWRDYPLATTLTARLGVPVRVANDADVQGLAAIEGAGTELVLTLGTGLGSALFIDGILVPNLELGHHPFRKRETYEEQLGKPALEAIGKKRWNKRLARAIVRLRDLFNFDRLYLGGGNAKAIRGAMPAGVRIVSNDLGLRGGIALWRDAPAARRRPSSQTAR